MREFYCWLYASFARLASKFEGGVFGALCNAPVIDIHVESHARVASLLKSGEYKSDQPQQQLLTCNPLSEFKSFTSEVRSAIPA